MPKPLVPTKKDAATLDAMIKRYLGSLQRGILTPEEALRNLREDYARHSEG